MKTVDSLGSEPDRKTVLGDSMLLNQTVAIYRIGSHSINM